MPEAPIYKDSDSLAYEGSVRFSNNGVNVFFPSFHPHSGQYRKQAFLKPSPFSLDGLHCFSPVFGREIVSHHFSSRKSCAVGNSCWGCSGRCSARGFKIFSAIQEIAGTHTASPKPVSACTPFVVIGYSSGTPCKRAYSLGVMARILTLPLPARIKNCFPLPPIAVRRQPDKSSSLTSALCCPSRRLRKKVR